MAKHTRLAYELLADSLKDRNLVPGESLNHILQQCRQTGALFPAILVSEGLVSDWELSRVSCDVFGLPFLPLEVYQPSETVVGLLEPDFMRQHSVVPLDRFGDMLTLAMPGMVEGDVLREIEEKLSVKVKPIVSSVESNQRWINSNVELPELAMLAGHGPVEPEGGWTNVLDAGEEAVQGSEPVETGPGGFPTLEVKEEELENSLQMFDLVEEEEALGGLGELDGDLDAGQQDNVDSDTLRRELEGDDASAA